MLIFTFCSTHRACEGNQSQGIDEEENLTRMDMRGHLRLCQAVINPALDRFILGAETAASLIDTWYSKGNDQSASHYFYIIKPAPDLPPYGDRGGLVAYVVKIQNGMEYTMFNKQFRMTAGLEELSSRLCYDGRLQNADSTLLANRPKSQAAFFAHPEGVQPDYGCPASVSQSAHRRMLGRKDHESQQPSDVNVDMYMIKIVSSSENVPSSSIRRPTAVSQESGQVW